MADRPSTLWAARLSRPQDPNVAACATLRRSTKDGPAKTAWPKAE
eukprot:CAMPEP_0198492050 /NCGR_PEP_ID=MMETSP1462-20131121/3204_1 /TAXON_ID=1333877 /ORGANISM="Brandtodinium nutriculum, Strain RCC3387" /LENGTH=44 /DNA_ID= /DNA_START= /DNA_END= /DNA_ORIENTATION=